MTNCAKGKTKTGLKVFHETAAKKKKKTNRGKKRRKKRTKTLSGILQAVWFQVDKYIDIY